MRLGYLFGKFLILLLLVFFASLVLDMTIQRFYDPPKTVLIQPFIHVSYVVEPEQEIRSFTLEVTKTIVDRCKPVGVANGRICVDAIQFPSINTYFNELVAYRGLLNIMWHNSTFTSIPVILIPAGGLTVELEPLLLNNTGTYENIHPLLRENLVVLAGRPVSASVNYLHQTTLIVNEIAKDFIQGNWRIVMVSIFQGPASFEMWRWDYETGLLTSYDLWFLLPGKQVGHIYIRLKETNMWEPNIFFLALRELTTIFLHPLTLTGYSIYLLLFITVEIYDRIKSRRWSLGPFKQYAMILIIAMVLASIMAMLLGMALRALVG